MIFFAIFLRITYASAKSLEMVQLVHRHGDRRMMDTYPTDPNPVSIWEEGLGMLTELGRSQLYELGEYTRERYRDFLPLTYSEDSIYVEASNYTRTVESAECFLAGLYEGFSSSLDIPVHVIPSTEDNKIVNSAPCPRFDQVFQDIIDNEISEEKEHEYEEALKSLSGYTGLNLNYSYEGLDRAATLFDTLDTEYRNGLTLPDWTADFYPQPLAEMASFIYYVAPFYNTESRRLFCGPLVKDIIQHFEDKINGDSDLKMWQYSGHDTTVGGLLVCLNLFDNTSPTYSSAVFVELYKDENDDYTVSITYRKDGDKEILTIPGCSEYCPFDEFKEIASDIIPDDWDAECNS